MTLIWLFLFLFLFLWRMGDDVCDGWMWMSDDQLFVTTRYAGWLWVIPQSEGLSGRGHYKGNNDRPYHSSSSDVLRLFLGVVSRG